MFFILQKKQFFLKVTRNQSGIWVVININFKDKLSKSISDKYLPYKYF